MKTAILATFLMVFSFYANGTAQESDRLLLEGSEYRLHTNPLEKLYTKHPEKRPESKSVVSSLWRGYVAFFEVKGEKLFINDLQIYRSDESKADPFQKVSV